MGHHENARQDRSETDTTSDILQNVSVNEEEAELQVVSTGTGIRSCNCFKLSHFRLKLIGSSIQHLSFSSQFVRSPDELSSLKCLHLQYLPTSTLHPKETAFQPQKGAGTITTTTEHTRHDTAIQVVRNGGGRSL